MSDHSDYSERPDRQQSLVVSFRYASDDMAPIYALEDALATAIADAEAGEYDGHEIALLDRDDAWFFMTGSDAHALFAAVRPVLEGCPLLAGAEAMLRFGPPEDEAAREQHVRLGQVVGQG